MSFDWPRFLEQHGIEYVTAGPSVVRGNIAVQCPFCGAADAGHHHMSISLEGAGWKCWRDRDHRGKSPIRLVRILIGCSTEEARRIVGVPSLVGGDLVGQVEAALGRAPASAADARALSEPREFKAFSAGLPSARPFLAYLRRRGFSQTFVAGEAERMGLRYCARGPFAGRVIFLVRLEGRLVTWTGRTISNQALPRYKTLSVDPESAASEGLPAALLPITSCLLWRDELMVGGEVLRLVEGPMDALKMRALGLSATCLFTNTISPAQVDLLRALAPRFRRRTILLDRGAEAQAMRGANDLAALGFELEWLPPDIQDPGELSAEFVGVLRT